MIKYFKNTRISSIDRFTLLNYSMVIDSKGVLDFSKADPETYKYMFEDSGDILIFANTMDELKKKLDEAGTDMVSFFADRPDIEPGVGDGPFGTDYVIFCDKTSFLTLLCRFWKTAFKKCKKAQRWRMFQQLRGYYTRIHLSYEAGSLTDEYFDLSKKEFEKLYDSVEPLPNERIWETLPIEYKLANYLYDNTIIDNEMFKKDMRDTYLGAVYWDMGIMRNVFNLYMHVGHLLYPEVFREDRPYNMTHEELKERLVEIWGSDIEWLFSKEHSLALPVSLHTKYMEENNFDLANIASIFIDFHTRGGQHMPRSMRDLPGDKVRELVLESVGFFYDIVSQGKENDVQAILDYIFKDPMYQFPIVFGRRQRYECPFLIETLERKDDKKFLENFYVEPN